MCLVFLFAWVPLCSTLLAADNAGHACVIERAPVQSVSPPSRPPTLTIGARQREAVRAAAAAYRGMPVQIIVHRPTPSYEAFAQGLAAALRSAGLAVSFHVEEAYAPPDCPHQPGLRVMYGAVRSGAVNAIAEALIRSRVLSDSLAGCRVAHEEEITFIVSSKTS